MSARILLLLVVLFVCSMTDLRSGMVFDWVTLPTLALMLLIGALQGAFVPALCGAGLAAGALLTLHLLTGGRGMGLGDVKLAALIGAAMGVVGALTALAIAFISGAVFGVTLLLLRRAQRKSAIPFAPFLTVGVGMSLLLERVLR